MTRGPRIPMSRRAFTLLEIMAVMALVVVVLLVLSATLAGAFQAAALVRHTANREAYLEALADQFRLDVAGASSAPDKLKERVAGPACLLLAGPGERLIVYRFEEGALRREETGGAKPLERSMPLGEGRTRVEFSRTPGERGIVTLKVIETRNGVAGLPLEVRAALGGDLR